jgi:hypothetical protein
MNLTPESSSPEILTPAPQGKDTKFALTSLALVIILVSIIGVMILLYAKPFEASKDIHDIISTSPSISTDSTKNIAADSLMQRKLELVKYMQEEKKDYRDFFLKICQMILLNLLLPILTAILGYKVGSSSKDE